MVRILITGGKGYIAQAIYASLKNEHNITLITRKDFDLTLNVIHIPRMPSSFFLLLHLI